jgi:hypothetical protein
VSDHVAVDERLGYAHEHVGERVVSTKAPGEPALACYVTHR